MNREYWLSIAEVVDALRVIPRILLASWIIFYMSYTWHITDQIMIDQDPSTSQATFAATVISALGTMSIWLGNIYITSRRVWEPDNNDRNK